MGDYLKVVYSEENTPKTDYPDKLAEYLFQTYKMERGQKLLGPGCGRGEFLNGFIKVSELGHPLEPRISSAHSSELGAGLKIFNWKDF